MTFKNYFNYFPVLGLEAKACQPSHVFPFSSGINKQEEVYLCLRRRPHPGGVEWGGDETPELAWV